jgi:hypothetical protein
VRLTLRRGWRQWRGPSIAAEGGAARSPPNLHASQTRQRFRQRNARADKRSRAAAARAPRIARAVAIRGAHINGWSVDLTLGDRYWSINTALTEFDLATRNDDELDKRFPCHRATKIEESPSTRDNSSSPFRHARTPPTPQRDRRYLRRAPSYANAGLSIGLSQIILQGPQSPKPGRSARDSGLCSLVAPGFGKTALAQATGLLAAGFGAPPFSLRASPNSGGTNGSFAPGHEDVRRLDQ